ncbi:hypothetical protein IJT93_01890 [bacterium]|nr:hypothetical protein [bacterium]
MSEKVRAYLHGFFAACANLYGAIALKNAWFVYQAQKGAPKLSRKDLLAFSSIARREEQLYYVYEIEELFEDEQHNELYRHIISKELIFKGLGKFNLLYRLLEHFSGKSLYIPENILAFAERTPSAEETALLGFLSDLTSETEECAPKLGDSIPNINKGRKLGQFSFLNASERYHLGITKLPAEKAAFLERCSGSEAEKLVRLFKFRDNVGWISFGDTCKYIVEELDEVGVIMDLAKFEELMRLIVSLHNNSHLWRLAGWIPGELAKLYSSSGPPTIAFGPGMQKAFADGALDKADFLRSIRERGLDVLE